MALIGVLLTGKNVYQSQITATWDPGVGGGHLATTLASLLRFQVDKTFKVNIEKITFWLHFGTITPLGGLIFRSGPAKYFPL